jgi:citrate lyase subunit beta/citryl-CoA lyase
MADLDGIRSLFVAPGTDTGRIQAGLASGADALFADFEDLVADDAKATARETVRAVFRAAPAAGTALFVRVNPPSSPYHSEDVAVIRELPLTGLVVPLATPQALAAFEPLGLPIIAMVETAVGVRAAYDMARMPGTARLTIGPGDLARELNLDLADPRSLLYVRSKLVIDSAAAGIAGPIDIPGRSDGDEFRQDAIHARALGFTGKMCFSQAQVGIVNDVFG